MLALALLLCTPASGVEVIDDPTAGKSVLVLEVEHGPEDEQTAHLLNSIIADELEDQRGLEVITAADIQRALELETNRAALGCDTGSESCLSEIADAMGADFVVFGEIGHLGAKIIVTVSVFDSVKARSAGREVVQSASLDELPTKIAAVVGELFPRVDADAPQPVVTRGGWIAPTLLAAGGVLLVGGGVTALWMDAEIGNDTGTEKGLKRSVGFIGLGAVVVGVAVVATGAWATLGVAE